MSFFRSKVFHLLQWLHWQHEEVECEDTGLCPYAPPHRRPQAGDVIDVSEQRGDDGPPPPPPLNDEWGEL
jgi:hypothetical protein